MNYRELIANIRDLGFSDDTEMEEFGELIPNSINRAISEINMEVDPIIGTLDLEIKTEDTGFIYVDLSDAYTETITGDGESIEFLLSRTPRRVDSVTYLSGGEVVVVNDYSVSGNVVSFTEAPPDGRVLTISYSVYGDPNFLEFTDTPVMYQRNGVETYSRFNDFDVAMSRIMVLNADENKGNFRVFYKMAHEDFRNTAEEMETELPLNLRVHHLVPLLASYYVWLEDEPVKAAQYYNLYDTKKQSFLESTINKPRMRVLEGGL